MISPRVQVTSDAVAILKSRLDCLDRLKPVDEVLEHMPTPRSDCPIFLVQRPVQHGGPAFLECTEHLALCVFQLPAAAGRAHYRCMARAGAI